MMIDTYEIVSPQSFLEEEVRCGFRVTSKRKKLWQMQMELFQFVDYVCKKNGMKYYAIGGTLLGAVRHQGYVPWDDDMDIAMFRSDYERFVQKAIQEVEAPFFVQSPETEEDYALSHIKIRNSSSTGATRFDFEFKYNKGVFIDVFPIDNIPDKLEDKADLLKGVHDFRKLLDVGARHFWYWQGFIKGNKEIVSEEEKNRLSRYVSDHSIPVICRDFDKLCSKYNDEETEYCGILALELTSERFHWKRSWFSEQVSLPFEYLSIQCPYEYDAVLRKTYGDYSVFVRGGALHGSLFFEPNVPYTDFVLSEKSSILV